MILVRARREGTGGCSSGGRSAGGRVRLRLVNDVIERVVGSLTRLKGLKDNEEEDDDGIIENVPERI